MSDYKKARITNRLGMVYFDLYGQAGFLLVIRDEGMLTTPLIE
jgi:hypothetical protein